jgi:hypothetical protein
MHSSHVLFMNLTYHSESMDGTLYTPQLMKIPTLLSSYHVGSGRESIDVQSGVYCCSVNGKRQQQITVANTVAMKECISFIYKSQI